MCTDIILCICEPFLDQEYHLYTCPALYEELVRRKTFCNGTVQAKRLGMPKDLAKEKLKPGETSFRRKADLVALKWQEKREVTLLTPAYNPTQTTTVTTRKVLTKKNQKML
ncbi:PiggyBac transposable element-derived protein 4-like [Plakobranchus ocellatus]|uniref:PiggyBac transposable element-derived protein 4-like n=1 Tax=Plakobranchus ocellatus TaxID=259542 RepID=A0AAV4DPW2_9GAST|nr:PiggyBac transposable element-derived protein 4-like [Plakobranchus ocellatus]